MTRSRPSKPGLIKGGFAALSTPVPGDVLSCMEELGLENIRQIEDEVSAKCPMHFERTGKEDNHPSFSVNSEEGYFNCFSCGYKGPFVLLVKDVLKIDRADASRWIRARGSIERVKRQLGYGYIDDLVKDGPIDTSQQYNEASLALFTEPPQWALDERNLDLESTQHYGVLWNTEKDSWVTPIRDPFTGELKGWQEKNDSYFRNRPRDVKKSDCLFGFDAFPGGWAVVVESPLDCARILSVGIEGAVSTFGAVVSQRQRDLLIGHTEGVIWAFDADRAGDKAARTVQSEFRRGFPMKFWNWERTPSDVKDPGEQLEEEIWDSYRTAHSSVVARF